MIKLTKATGPRKKLYAETKDELLLILKTHNTKVQSKKDRKKQQQRNKQTNKLRTI